MADGMAIGVTFFFAAAVTAVIVLSGIVRCEGRLPAFRRPCTNDRGGEEPVTFLTTAEALERMLNN